MENNTKTKIKPRKGIKIFSILIIILTIFFLYARYVNTSGLKIKEIAVYDELLPEDYNGLKIAHFTDIHYGRTTGKEELNIVITELNELNADIVVFTGDLFDYENINEDTEKFITDSLKNVKANLFKFACIGDYDTKYLETYKRILEQSGFILLDNENKLVYYDSTTPINIVGITNTIDTDKLFTDNFNITIMHEPDKIKELPKTNIALAGHSLGGQLVIPFIGGAIKQNGASTYINSYYKINNTQLYVSNGIGTQNFSFRTFNKPSISLYRLYKN